MPYTGVFSEYGASGRAEAAYFRMVNDRGGVNGRKINFVSLDFASDAAKFVELAHRLVEQRCCCWSAPGARVPTPQFAPT